MATQGAEGHAAGTEVPAGPAHEDVFPPFDSTYFAPQLIWLALIFGTLYLLMSKVALPRVAGIFSTRKQAIADDLAAARKAQEDAAAAAAAHEKTLAGAKAKAQALGQQAHAEAAAAADASRGKLEAELGAKLTEAETKIAETKTAAMANVDAIAVEVAHAILQRITGRAADPKAVVDAVAAAKA
ncbi:F-type H+-transporting ATPase subunit b [Rhodoblastus acidophilus]|uniref:F0F1 ATP synthase subunit B family protein n=1 Tax=Rhodoblastus acidophilus TaxID=1074 RepID=UPI0022240BC2|nr:F0F1 ATP synthase subunit B' [Rhodoblastus acidophilus]MCW2317746.1 F-type H+-transporting ATPase subunit b [Rhodoblastus acidophilus]